MYLLVGARLRYRLIRLTKRRKAGVSICQKGARRIYSDRVHFDRMSTSMRLGEKKKNIQDSRGEAECHVLEDDREGVGLTNTPAHCRKCLFEKLISITSESVIVFSL